MTKPLILITNDDSVHSPGIAALTEIAQEFGDVVVIAPDTLQSGKSSALTINQPLFYREIKNTPSLKIFSCNGTPTDCVKLSLSEQLPFIDRKPTILLSGINHGTNASINVIYSGTLGAAIEGALHGIRSIGFSVVDHSWEEDLSYCKPFFRNIIAEVLRDQSLPQNLCLNINAPMGEIKGIKVCRQSAGSWHREIVPAETPFARPCYWLVGDFENDEPKATDTDQYALANGFISIVPVQTDMTDYSLLHKLQL